jgi:hypothetical protein
MSFCGVAMSRLYVAKRVILPIWMLLQTALKGVSVLYSQVSAYLRSRGEMLLSGQIDEMITGYQFPLPVFLQTKRMILQSSDEVRSILYFLRDALLERGVVALRPQINAIDLPRNGRFRVWVDWHELAMPAEGTRMSSVIYYCRETSTGVQVEMANYTRQSMPELSSQLTAFAMSA